jgi:hypothetical protein
MREPLHDLCSLGAALSLPRLRRLHCESRQPRAGAAGVPGETMQDMGQI